MLTAGVLHGHQWRIYFRVRELISIDFIVQRYKQMKESLSVKMDISHAVCFHGIMMLFAISILILQYSIWMIWGRRFEVLLHVKAKSRDRDKETPKNQTPSSIIRMINIKQPKLPYGDFFFVTSYKTPFKSVVLWPAGVIFLPVQLIMQILIPPWESSRSCNDVKMTRFRCDVTPCLLIFAFWCGTQVKWFML